MRGKFWINTWYGSDKSEYIPLAAKGGKFIRNIRVKDASPTFVKISDDILASEYIPFVYGTIEKFLGLLNIAKTSLSYFLPPHMIAVADFLLKELSVGKTMDNNSGSEIEDLDLKAPINNERLIKAMQKINENETLNWLAVKAFYVGFDQQMSSNGYEDWINQETNNTPVTSIENQEKKNLARKNLICLQSCQSTLDNTIQKNMALSTQCFRWLTT